MFTGFRKWWYWAVWLFPCFRPRIGPSVKEGRDIYEPGWRERESERYMAAARRKAAGEPEFLTGRSAVETLLDCLYEGKRVPPMVACIVGPHPTTARLRELCEDPDLND